MPEILFKDSVPRELMPEIIKGLYWISSSADNFRFDNINQKRLIYDYNGLEDLIDIEKRIVKLTEDIQCAQSLSGKSSRRYTQHKCQVKTKTYEQLIEKKLIKEVGKGSYLWAGVAAKLQISLNNFIRKIALTHNFEEWITPSLIDMKLLHQTGYLKSFPHYLNYLYHFPEDMKVIEGFKTSVNMEKFGSDNSSMGGTHFSGNVLAPTVCCSVLSAFADAGNMDEDSVIKITASQPCFRHEGRSTKGIHRLSEFHMRELIVLGNQASILIWRDKLTEIMFNLCEHLNLEAYFESASDPFFLEDSKVKRIYQNSFELKQELRLIADVPEETIAGGSVNLHQDHFGKSFNLHSGGNHSWSCCAGFGMDRICYSIFSQFGTNCDKWPESIKNLIELDM